MADAEALARGAGTAEDIIENVKGQDFLQRCLAKAKFTPDLLQDTLDACDINDLNALVLGSGLLSVTEASEKLFLMQDEANTVLTVCRKECLRAGVNFGDGATLTAEERAEVDDAPAPPALPARAPSQRKSPGRPDKLQQQMEYSQAATSTTAPSSFPAAAPVPTTAPPTVAEPMATLTPPAAYTAPPAAELASPPSTSTPAPPPAAAPPPEPQLAVSSAPANRTPALQSLTPAASVDHAHPDPNFLIKPPVAVTPSVTATAATVTPHSNRSHIPRPAASPYTPAAPHPTPRERPAAKPATRASPSTTTPIAARDTPKPATSSSASMNGRHTPAQASAAAVTASSSMPRPPRPTSAPLSARASVNGPVAPKRPESAFPTTPATPATLPSYAKPTAAHKARFLNKEDTDLLPASGPSPQVTFASTNKPLRRFGFLGGGARASTLTPTSTPEEKKEPKKPVFDNIRSSLLRPTAAFLAWSSGKGKKDKPADLKSSQGLTASDLGKTGRNASARQSDAAGSGTPSSRPTTTPEPFRLSGMDRHQKAQEELARKREEKAREEGTVYRFKAMPLPSPGSTAGSASKAAPKRTTATQSEAQ